MERKRAKKMDEKEDRISDLPDSIIHHILSFLPTTKEAIKTGILSKRWQYQWTRVPVLIFTCGTSHENFHKFVECTLILHDCSKIKKFHLEYYSPRERDPQFDAKLRFATRRHVEELDLRLQESLPIFLFNNASLVKLNTLYCTIMPNGIVNWGCLTELEITDCSLTDQALEHILSGSPSLKSLELWFVYFEKLVIASKSLKRLHLSESKFSTIDIACPELEKLSLGAMRVLGCPHLFARAIENAITGSLLLESFELYGSSPHNGISQACKLVVASKSLKRLVLRQLMTSATIEISSPKLEKLELIGCLEFKTVKFLHLPPSLSATIDFHHGGGKHKIRMIKDILRSFQHVKQLEIRSEFFEVISDLALQKVRLVPVLNIKCLTLNSCDLNDCHHGITCVLDSSHALEELVIKAPNYRENYDYPEKLNEFGENYWNSSTQVFNCLASNLKTIKMIGLPCRDHNRKLVLKFVQFLLKNAKVLEKMVVQLKNKDCETTCSISQELLSMSRYSQSAKFELLCS